MFAFSFYNDFVLSIFFEENITIIKTAPSLFVDTSINKWHWLVH